MKIYLATPYSTPKPGRKVAHEGLLEARFRLVTRVAAVLFLYKHKVFSPITHSHPMTMISPIELPKTFEFWREFDESMIDWSDYVVVLKFPGYIESKGVQSEIRHALIRGKPVIRIDPAAFLGVIL